MRRRVVGGGGRDDVSQGVSFHGVVGVSLWWLWEGYGFGQHVRRSKEGGVVMAYDEGAWVGCGRLLVVPRDKGPGQEVGKQSTRPWRLPGSGRKCPSRVGDVPHRDQSVPAGTRQEGKKYGVLQGKDLNVGRSVDADTNEEGWQEVQSRKNRRSARGGFLCRLCGCTAVVFSSTLPKLVRQSTDDYIVVSCSKLVLWPGIWYQATLFGRRQEMSLRRRDVEQWMSHRRLPEELKRKVRESERYSWAATRGVNEEMLLENLPEDLQREIRRHLFRFIKKVRIFALMEEPILDAICEKLKQKTYIKDSRVLNRGDGKKSRIPIQRLQSNRTVRCLTNVEAFLLKARDLEEVTSLFARFLRNPRVQGAIRYESPYWRCFAATRIQVAW
ncbi:hypothetical protein KSS87_018539, partial [Heliosperma pusillum]